MDTSDLEGTLILEKLAEHGRVDDLYDAVDADDLAAASRVLREVGLHEESVRWVLTQMRAATGER